MEIIRLLLYIIAPWSPLLFRKKLYSNKLWKVALATTIGLLPFVMPFMLGYSFGIPRVFSIVFILFLVSFSTLLWLFTNTGKFAFFTIVINLLTALLFWSINWQPLPYTAERGYKSTVIQLNEDNPNYSDILSSGHFLGRGPYAARKKYLGGLLVKTYSLHPHYDASNNDCIYEGYDYDRGKTFYWDKCKNIIKE